MKRKLMPLWSLPLLELRQQHDAQQDKSEDQSQPGQRAGSKPTLGPR